MARGTDAATDAAARAAGRAAPLETGDGGELAVYPPIERLTRWLALIGGLLMLAAIALTMISVAGRYLFNAPLPGDYESIEIICAVGIFLFFPYTHATGGNIVVRFFTASFARRYRIVLDLLHDVIFTGIAALLAWRLAIGLADKFHSGESTMLVRIPYWWSYSFAVASMALLCVVCLARLAAGVRALRQ
jgi:TRAP-type C4-dicarboxylate transport system permease small subunit